MKYESRPTFEFNTKVFIASFIEFVKLHEIDNIPLARRTFQMQTHQQVFEAPQLPIPKIKDDKWSREEKAFFLQLPKLLNTLRGKWVAIHNEQVVEKGDTLRSVLIKVRERFPKTEIYIQLVDEKLPVAKMMSPRKHLR